MADYLNTTNLSRRSILGTGIAAAGALAVSALPAIAIASNADAKLLQLCRNWHRLHRAYNVAIRRQDDAEMAQGPLPPVPTILQQRIEVFPGVPEDDLIPAYHALDGYDHRHEWISRGHAKAVAEGKFRLERGLFPGADPNDTTLVSIPETARAKARECLKAHEQWERARKARTAESECREAIANQFGARLDDMARAIAETPAQTMQGLRAKLAIIDAETDCADDTGLIASALDDMRRIDTGAQLSPPFAA
jgi:hypothetical protein